MSVIALGHGYRLDQMLEGMAQDLITIPPREGIIHNTIAVDGEACYVKLDEFDQAQLTGPCIYMPRGTVLPQKGDRCLVVESDTGALWMSVWWPFG